MAKAKKKKELSLEEKLEQALVPVDEQLYEVPENWCWTYLRNVAQWGSGGTPSRKNASFYEGDIPWVKTGELEDTYLYDTEEKISEEAIKNSSAKLFPVESVLIAMYGATIGKTAILGIEATTNQACACAICNESVYNKYLFYYLRSQKDKFIEQGKGGAQPNISQEIIKNNFIPIPPKEEQQRIVEQIESLFRKLDEAKLKIEELIDGHEKRKAAILYKLFSGKLTSKWREKNNESKNDWIIDSLGKYVESQYGYTEKATYEMIGPKFLRITDIQDNQVYWEKVPYCKISDDDYERYAIHVGDIVVARTGATTGKSYMIQDEVESVFASFLIRLVVKSEKLIPEYLYCFMQSQNYWHQITDLSSGIAQPGVNSKKFKELQIPIPSVSEQKEMVNIANELLKAEKGCHEVLIKTGEQITSMKKSVLVKVFRGELGTNNPDEESAIQLLKSVL